MSGTESKDNKVFSLATELLTMMHPEINYEEVEIRWRTRDDGPLKVVLL